MKPLIATFFVGIAVGSAMNAEQAQPPQAPPAPFEEASIRPCDPDNIPPAPEGARGGGANSFQMTPGRTHAVCMTLATIIRHAYGYGPVDLDFINPGGRGRGLQLNNIYGLGVEDGRRVRGGPNWVREERYTIDAVAKDAADAESMSGPMMRALLEQRFQLKAHIESEQVPAFDLTIARGGLKIKPVESGACEPVPNLRGQPGQPAIPPTRNFADVRKGAKPSCGLLVQRNGPNNVFVGGEALLSGFARGLGSPLGGVQVFDKTGITDKFNFVFEYVIDENAPGPQVLRNLPPPPDVDTVPRAQTIFVAIEQQLGLKLEAAKAPRAFIVVDEVQRPTPN